MALTTKVHAESKTIPYTPGSAVAAGDVAVVGSIVGIAPAPIAASVAGTLDIEGIFDVPKASGSTTAIAVGSKVYWSVADQQATTTASSHKVLGYTTVAAADGDTTVRVALSRA